jgi:hypothetical protein
LDGTLSVSSEGDYQLYLDGVTITGSDGPALNLESSQKAFIVTASGTTNVLTDSATRTTMTMKAALYGKGPMVFSGEGTLIVTGSYKHGIFSKDYIRVRSGELDVAVSAKDAVRSVNGFIFDDGDLTINATGTVTDDESKGIKVEGSEDDDGADRGYVVINGGYLYCASSDNDAIDSNGPLTISGGVIVAIGEGSPEGAFDCDNNTFAVTGGTLVGIGGATSTPTTNASTQNVVILGSGTKDSTISLMADDSTVVAFAFTIPQSYSTMLLSSPDIETGTEYTTYTGGTASGNETFYGLYLGDLSYSDGTAGTSFTVSSSVTNNGTGGGMNGGSQRPGRQEK